MSNATDYEHERKSTSQLVSSAMTPATDYTSIEQHPATPSIAPASYMSMHHRQHYHKSASWLHDSATDYTTIEQQHPATPSRTPASYMSSATDYGQEHQLATPQCR